MSKFERFIVSVFEVGLIFFLYLMILALFDLIAKLSAVLFWLVIVAAIMWVVYKTYEDLGKKGQEDDLS